MSKAWGGAGAGAWALDAERAEEEEERQRAAIEGSFPSDVSNSQSFPSLKEAATAKTKKKKPVTVPLAEFNAAFQVGRGAATARAFDSKGLTPDEMIRLPTGPRERSSEELEASRFGGGFRSYVHGTGGVRSGGFVGGRRGEDGDGGRRPYGGSGGFDDDSRRTQRTSDFDQPSREEAVDHWTDGKKSAAPPMDSGRQDRYGMLGGGGSSRADEVDSWSSVKKALPARQQSYSSGYRISTNSTDSNRWVREGLLQPVSVGGERERRKLVLDPPKVAYGAQDVAPARSRPSPFGDAKPREEVLSEKGLDWRKMESEIDIKKSGGPSSSHSSRPSSAQSSRPESPGSLGGGSSAAVVEGLQKPRPKINPFGDAKPREIFLQEQGKDWKKIDRELEHRRVGRPETDQEKLLKEEIDHLKKILSTEATENINAESSEASAEDDRILLEQLHQKENALELLVQELDDKVRHGQRGSGRSDNSRPTDASSRPYAGSAPADTLAVPFDKRRGFRGGRERNILDNRNIERSTSKERW